MNDLISRQAAIDALSCCQTYLFDPRDDDKKISLEDAKNAIEQLPSVQPDVPERNVGKWIIVKRHEHYPSGKPYDQLQCPFCKRLDNNGDGNYCGYCGAKLKGENNGRSNQQTGGD